MPFLSVAYESLTVSTTSVGLTVATYGSSNAAIIFVEDAAIRYRLDGVAPTASVGLIAEQGSFIFLASADNLGDFRAIRRDGTDAILRCQFGLSDQMQFGVASAGRILETGETVVDTELPAAAALADNTATPTAPAVGAFGMVFDGSTWDFMRGTAADGVTVNTELAAAVAAAETVANPTVPQVLSHGMLFNGTGAATWDRYRANWETTPAVSAARTATFNTPTQTNYNHSGTLYVVDITATPNDAQTLTPAIQIRDFETGKFASVTAFPAITASTLGATPTTATFMYFVKSGAVETAAVTQLEVQGLFITRQHRMQVVHSAAGSWTYSISVMHV